MERGHEYRVEVRWTGDRGQGTSSYVAYGREHTIQAASKPVLLGSSDPAFRGDPSRYNPEELLVAALSSCHMLSYLHLCTVHGIRVVGYEDHAEGVMEPRADGTLAFSRVTLHPHVKIASGDRAKAEALHEDAHKACFIASSVNFPVTHQATIELGGSGAGAGHGPP
ncbi:MAG TPA: OsmC family protein [Thermoplasmata archaeon]|nr:OsmC family protein [Thermoplasmata archaeon]